MNHYLISKQDVDTLRLALSEDPDALYTLESGLHATPFAPPEKDGELSALEFARTYLEPAVLEAKEQDIALFALAIEVESDEMTLSIGGRATVAHLGEEDEYSALLKDVLGEVRL